MAIGPDSTQEKLNAAILRYLLLIFMALCVQIWGVSVENMYLVWGDVDVAEEMFVHEAVVAFGVLLRDADVFVHVEGHDMFEGDASGFVGFDEELIDAFGAASCGKTEDKRAVFGGGEVVDSFLGKGKLV